MNPTNPSPARIVFRITTAALALAVGLVYLTACSQPAIVPGRLSPLSSPLRIYNSPVASPTARVPAPLTSPAFSLTVLHTNDTWGYLVPCG